MEGADEKKLEITEHLAELRGRIIRVIVYLGVGGVACWFLYPFIREFICSPVEGLLAKQGSESIYTNAPSAFFARLQVTLVSALIMMMPLVVWEVWRFIAPGLTRAERKAFYFTGPLVLVLFWGGVAMGAFLVPAAFRWFLSYAAADGVRVLQDRLQFVTFYMKMALACGVAFQLPVVFMILGRMGVVSSGGLLLHWRQAMVGVAIFAAVITPSNDAPTMLILCAPLVALYFVSIALVKLVEPKE